MKLLLDTHILIWMALDELPQSAVDYIVDETNALFFSPASIWEATIKHSQKRPDFTVSPYALYNGLIENNFIELPLKSPHSLTVGTLPPIHKDPFDRILLAQSISEGIPLLTFDKVLKQYPAPIILLGK